MRGRLMMVRKVNKKIKQKKKERFKNKKKKNDYKLVIFFCVKVEIIYSDRNLYFHTNIEGWQP